MLAFLTPGPPTEQLAHQKLRVYEKHQEFSHFSETSHHSGRINRGALRKKGSEHQRAQHKEEQCQKKVRLRCSPLAAALPKVAALAYSTVKAGAVEWSRVERSGVARHIFAQRQKHMYMYAYTYIHTYMYRCHPYIYAYMHVCVRAFLYAYIHLHMYKCMLPVEGPLRTKIAEQCCNAVNTKLELRRFPDLGFLLAGHLVSSVRHASGKEKPIFWFMFPVMYDIFGRTAKPRRC